jgi:SAM-dependent methyltransferase
VFALPLPWLLPAVLLTFALTQKPRPKGIFLTAALEFATLAAINHLAVSGLEQALILFLVSLYALLATIGYRFWRRTGYRLEGSLLRLSLEEPENAYIVLRNEINWRDCAILAGVVILAILPALSTPQTDGRIPAIVAVICGLLLVLLAFLGISLPPGATILRSIVRTAVRPARHIERSRPAQGGIISEPPIEGARCNVLLIIMESLNRQSLNGPAGIQAAPHYHEFLTKYSNQITIFGTALANSCASDVSYPSIFTGLSPEQPIEAFNSHPLLWSSGKLAGCFTSFYSSQSLGWAGLKERLVDDTLDRAVYREVLQAPAANDLAMDDRDLNRVIISDLTQQQGSFLTVVNYNMLHYPFLADNAIRSFDPANPEERYLSALALFDNCFSDLMRALEETGKLRNTAVIFTGDHGEQPNPKDYAAALQQKPHWITRINDLNPSLLHVPFWIRLPEGVITESERQSLNRNSRLPISNLDIFPTITGLLGITQPDTSQVSGNSLLQPLPDNRLIVCLNTGALRSWDLEPFGIAHNGELLIYHDGDRCFELIDLFSENKQNKWPSLPISEKQRWMGHAQTLPVIGSIVERRNLAEQAVLPPIKIKEEYDALSSGGVEAELFKLDNWYLFTSEEWKDLCLRTASRLNLQAGNSVFESGCGAGAFIDVLHRHYSVQVAGVDFSDKLIDIARQRLPGDFWVGDIQDLSFVKDCIYDCAVSHGVFMYLASRESAHKAASEMVRITKPGGTIYIGIINDPDRLASYRLRNNQDPSGNYLLTRKFWLDFAAEKHLAIEMVDQDCIFTKEEGYDGHSRLRYSVFLRKEREAV